MTSCSNNVNYGLIKVKCHVIDMKCLMINMICLLIEMKCLMIDMIFRMNNMKCLLNDLISRSRNMKWRMIDFQWRSIKVICCLIEVKWANPELKYCTCELNYCIFVSVQTIDFMKKISILLLSGTLLISCSPTENETNASTETPEPTTDSVAVIDTTPRVTGIGGIFFFSDDPGKTKEWYAENLGLEVNEWGSTFETRNANRPEEINYLQWSPFKEGSEYFAPSEKEFMINYRVQNIEGLVRNLRNSGVTIVDSIETYDYGKFVHIMDHEGNKIELWEPIDSVLTAIGGETTK